MSQHAQVRDQGQGREFVLVSPVDKPDDGTQGGQNSSQADVSEITFTQKDVRELQLAKGAMRTGVQVLLAKNHVAEDEIDQLVIAGAFGTYIDVASAQTIGMLPGLPKDRIRQVGNAAGMGAKMALISMSARAEAQQLARKIGYVELGTIPDFATMFARATYLE